MAIARKIDPAALARAFADEISAYPQIKRIWYRYMPGIADPDRMILSFNILLDGESKAADMAIVDALTRLQTECFEELNVGSFEFSIAENDPLTLADLVSPDAIELPLRGG
jgi:hypothetical protein